ncbi:MAG: HDOD domain-containing protein [Deltaproteobacteria bacterium]|nr:HDOD domain-containing protein [Deltaproteobacteria bacterium]
MITHEQILGKIDNLPTLPTAVAQLSRLIASPTSSAKDFETVIRPDPSLTANLLRLANSAYFGLRREVISVKQAITLLGSKRVFDIAASAGFSKIIPPRLPGYGVPSASFWLHSIAVAVLAERLATELHVKAPGLLFTAGLLHDLGKLAIGSFLENEEASLRDRLAEESESFVNLEKEILGTDHGEVGEELAKLWDLPEAVIWTAKWHHNPNDAGDIDTTLVDLVHIADAMAHMFGYGADLGELSRTIDPNVAQRLNFNIHSLEAVSSETETQIREMGEMFN